ncbi:MAG: hypothetical protein ACK4ZS_07315 [Sulfurimicrobium sp.]
MDRRTGLPTYEVEFIPLERRIRDDRRKHSMCGYSGPERRQYRDRRGGEPAAERPRQQV